MFFAVHACISCMWPQLIYTCAVGFCHHTLRTVCRFLNSRLMCPHHHHLARDLRSTFCTMLSWGVRSSDGPGEGYVCSVARPYSKINDFINACNLRHLRGGYLALTCGISPSEM
jgi:hypothetical protein